MPRLTEEQIEEILELKEQGEKLVHIAMKVLGARSRESTVRALLKRGGTLGSVTDENALESVLEGLELTKKVHRVSTILPKTDSGIKKPLEGNSGVSGKTILVIGDLQIKPNTSLDYCRAIGNYIASKQPDIIVNIGDAFDLPSLSMYDKGKLKFEGRRLVDDIKAGREGLALISDAFKDIKGYNPEMHFTVGNHEFRAARFASDQPELSGFVGVEQLGIEDFGYTVHPFLEPVEIEGILCCHYFPNEFTGKPVGGNAHRLLKIIGQSFIQGHVQKLDMAISKDFQGRPQVGVVNGSSYDHYEDYKGMHNTHFRGIVVLHEVKDGGGLPMPVSLEYLKEYYLP